MTTRPAFFGRRGEKVCLSALGFGPLHGSGWSACGPSGVFGRRRICKRSSHRAMRRSKGRNPIGSSIRRPLIGLDVRGCPIRDFRRYQCVHVRRWPSSSTARRGKELLYRRVEPANSIGDIGRSTAGTTARVCPRWQGSHACPCNGPVGRLRGNRVAAGKGRCCAGGAYPWTFPQAGRTGPLPSRLLQAPQCHGIEDLRRSTCGCSQIGSWMGREPGGPKAATRGLRFGEEFQGGGGHGADAGLQGPLVGRQEVGRVGSG